MCSRFYVEPATATSLLPPRSTMDRATLYLRHSEPLQHHREFVRCFEPATCQDLVPPPFALMKGPCDFARCRYLGIARNGTHLQLLASAYDL